MPPAFTYRKVGGWGLDEIRMRWKCHVTSSTIIVTHPQSNKFRKQCVWLVTYAIPIVGPYLNVELKQRIDAFFWKHLFTMDSLRYRPLPRTISSVKSRPLFCLFPPRDHFAMTLKYPPIPQAVLCHRAVATVCLSVCKCKCDKTKAASEKSSIMSRLHELSMSLRWTVYTLPLTLIIKYKKLSFSRRNSATYKVSLRENFQRQSCTAFTGLSNRTQMVDEW